MKVAIADIIVTERKRNLNQEKIKELANSIIELGLLQPILITSDKRLIAGMYRLEACKQLGWHEIDCIVKEYDELDAELAEIDENLMRTELTVLERSEQLKRRKEIYETKYPEARPYSNEKQRQRRLQQPREIISPGFATDTAAKLGVSPRTIQQEVQIAERLADDVKNAIRGTALEDSKSELLNLARQTPEEQRKTVGQLLVSSNSNEWYTPTEYIESARKVLGVIDLDPASCEEANKVVKASKFYTAQDDGLQYDWPGKVWLNPPYGGLTGKFVKKLVDQYEAGITTEAILLINSHATDTDWFQLLWDYVLCFTDHRINFYGPNGKKGNGSTHGSIFVYLGPNPKAFAREFAKYGAILKRWVFNPKRNWKSDKTGVMQSRSLEKCRLKGKKQIAVMQMVKNR